MFAIIVRFIEFENLKMCFMLVHVTAVLLLSIERYTMIIIMSIYLGILVYIRNIVRQATISVCLLLALFSNPLAYRSVKLYEFYINVIYLILIYM